MHVEKYVYSSDIWEHVETIEDTDEDYDKYLKKAISVYDKWRSRAEGTTGIRLINDENKAIRLCHA